MMKDDSMALFSDDPEASKLRETIDADIVTMEVALSNLQRHMLNLKVLSRRFSRERQEQMHRMVLTDDINERARLLTLEQTANTKAIDKGKNWDNKT